MTLTTKRKPERFILVASQAIIAPVLRRMLYYIVFQSRFGVAAREINGIPLWRPGARPGGDVDCAERVAINLQLHRHRQGAGQYCGCADVAALAEELMAGLYAGAASRAAWPWAWPASSRLWFLAHFHMHDPLSVGACVFGLQHVALMA